LDTTRPLSALPESQVPEMQGFMELHERHTAESLPYDAALRLVAMQRDVFARWRTGLIGFFVLGLFALSPVVAVGGITALLLFVAYLPYAHPSSWTIYYMEALPVVAMITALGFMLAMTWLRRKMRRGDGAGGAASLVGIVLAVVLFAGSLPIIRTERGRRDSSAAPRLALWDVAARLPTPRNLLFVRDERKAPHTMVTNDPELTHARTWLVHDLGTENVRLQELEPDRTAYVIDVNAGTLIQLAPIQARATR
jgi:hypothetical protein